VTISTLFSITLASAALTISFMIARSIHRSFLVYSPSGGVKLTRQISFGD
jgi:hypothetical protein